MVECDHQGINQIFNLLINKNVKRFAITTDASWEAKLDSAIYQIDESNLFKIMESTDFGKDLDKIYIVVMCRD